VKREVAGSLAPVEASGASEGAWLLPSSAEMAELDAHAIGSGTPALQLMERAGQAVAQHVSSLLAGERREVLVLCGPGNNGGDGLVAARVLSEAGVPATALIAGAGRYSPECIAQMRRCDPLVSSCPAPQALLDAGIKVPALERDRIERLFGSAAVIVDALLGTGQRPALADPIRGLVARLLEERAVRPAVRVVAVDVPTGVDCDTGRVSNPCVQADRTVAIELIMRGCMQYPARGFCGEIIAVGVGIPARSEVEFRALGGATLPEFPRRAVDVHKGELGRVLVVGGCASMPGAPTLAALGALHAGAGIVLRVTRGSWDRGSVPPECIHVVLGGDGAQLSRGDVAQVLAAAQEADVVVLGPGLGQGKEAAEFLDGVLQGLKAVGKRVVLDADALNLLAERGLGLEGLVAVITPHPGEAARLLGRAVSAIQGDRFGAVRELARRYSCTALLKGAGTIVYGEGAGGVVLRGTPYLATAGSGDVLSGVVGCLLARCASPYAAAALAAHVHACAGERAAIMSGGPVLASEIARAVSGVIGELERW